MNDVEKFVFALQELIDNAEDRLINSTRTHQSRVIKKIIAMLRNRNSGLILKRGDIVTTGKDGSANRKRLREIRKDLKTLANSDFVNGEFERYSEAITEIERLSSAYYAGAFSGFKKGPIKELAKEAASRTISNLSNSENNLTDPINQILTISNPIGIAEVIDSLEEGITSFTQKGGVQEVKVRGHLERYINSEILGNGRTRQSLVRDTLHGFSRNLTTVVTESLGLEWFVYLGGLVRDSRDFCRERNGKYWHQSEVNAWASEDWPEKITGTNQSNIAENLGGYNCRHILQPVPVDLVPDKDLARIGDE